MYKNILITGAGGTVGCVLTNFYLSQGVNIYAVDRSEEGITRLLDIQKNFSHSGKLQILFEDLLNDSFFEKASSLKEVECIVHCASLKHFSVGVEFPEKVFNENVTVFKKIEELARDHANIQRVVLCSSDKAAQPISAMGQSKKVIEELSEKIKIRNVQFINIRFANILYSSGSLLQKLEECIQSNGKFLIRDGEMTRYLLTKSDTVTLVDYALRFGQHGDVICFQAPAARIRDLVHEYLIKRKSSIEVVEVDNPFGESIHEALFNEQELEYVYKSGDFFIYNKKCGGSLKRVEKEYALSSSNALSKDSLKKLYE